MKKVRVMIALTAVIAMAVSTAVFAAPSPVAGTVNILDPVTGRASAATVKAPTQTELKELASYIAQNAAAAGMVPTVKSNVDIVAPAGYKGGDVPMVLAVAGLKNGAKNVFAYIRLANGKVLILPCTVNKGYVGFITPAFGTVSIVELNPATAMTAGIYGKATTTLH